MKIIQFYHTGMKVELGLLEDFKEFEFPNPKPKFSKSTKAPKQVQTHKSQKTNI